MGSSMTNGSHDGSRFDFGMGGFLCGLRADVERLKRLMVFSKSRGTGWDRRAALEKVLMSSTKDDRSNEATV